VCGTATLQAATSIVCYTYELDKLLQAAITVCFDLTLIHRQLSASWLTLKLLLCLEMKRLQLQGCVWLTPEC
jgi:hypothetical protein